MTKNYFRKVYKAGSVVFREGEPGDEAYIVERGRVEISARQRGREVLLSTLGPGEIFGEMAVIDDRARSATARAIEETELVTVTRGQLNDRIAASDPVVSLLLKVILERYRGALRHWGGGPFGEILAEHDAASGRRGRVEERQRILEKIKLERELTHALDCRDFELYYQPIVDLRNRSIAGLEALIRWNSPDRGFLYPCDFISLSEETGLIVPIGSWVLKEACSQLASFQAACSATGASAATLFMSVNVSRRQFLEIGFAEDIARTLKDSGIRPGRLKLEITESLLIEDYNAASLWIEDCKKMGLGIAVDDFGTGYASLGYLHLFPIDTLKIDQCFIRSMLEDKRSLEIVRAVIGLARGLEVTTIAEGIEDSEQLSNLAQLGCDYGQGFYFSPPMQADQICQLLSNYPDWRECG